MRKDVQTAGIVVTKYQTQASCIQTPGTMASHHIVVVVIVTESMLRHSWQTHSQPRQTLSHSTSATTKSTIIKYLLQYTRAKDTTAVTSPRYYKGSMGSLMTCSVVTLHHRKTQEDGSHQVSSQQVHQQKSHRDGSHLVRLCQSWQQTSLLKCLLSSTLLRSLLWSFLRSLLSSLLRSFLRSLLSTVHNSLLKALTRWLLKPGPPQLSPTLSSPTTTTTWTRKSLQTYLRWRTTRTWEKSGKGRWRKEMRISSMEDHWTNYRIELD